MLFWICGASGFGAAVFFKAEVMRIFVVSPLIFRMVIK